MKNRVMQALASGRPTVGTRHAFSGMAVTDGVDVLVGESVGELSDCVARLLSSAGLRARIGAAARRLASTCYSQEVIGAQWESLYRNLLRDGDQ